MEFLPYAKAQIFVLCWTIVALTIFNAIDSIYNGYNGSGSLQILACIFWIWWPFVLTKDARKKLKYLAGIKNE